MKIGTAILAALTILSSAAFGQHGTAESGYFPIGYNGDIWTGVIAATNEATREITLSYTKGQKTETFVGVLEDGYKVKMKDGSLHELRLSEIQLGTRVTVYYMQAERKEGGKKRKYYKIFRIKPESNK